MSASISIVVARAENGVIGDAGAIPWKVSADLKRFRRITMGKPVIMGRKTYESIGRPLDGRDNIVITRQADYPSDGIYLAKSIEDAIQQGQALAARRGSDEIMVIGGGEIYGAIMAVSSRIYLSQVHESFKGDTLFAAPDPAVWREVSREELPCSHQDTAAASLVVYERRDGS